MIFYNVVFKDSTLCIPVTFMSTEKYRESVGGPSNDELAIQIIMKKFPQGGILRICRTATGRVIYDTLTPA